MWRRAFGIPAPPAWPVAEAFTLSLVVAAAHAAEPHRLTPDRCLGLLAAVAVLSALGAGRTTAAAVALLAWLFDNGFVTNHAGDLRWHTTADLRAVAVLAGCALVARHLPQHPNRPLERTHG